MPNMPIIMNRWRFVAMVCLIVVIGNVIYIVSISRSVYCNLQYLDIASGKMKEEKLIFSKFKVGYRTIDTDFSRLVGKYFDRTESAIWKPVLRYSLTSRATYPEYTYTSAPYALQNLSTRIELESLDDREVKSLIDQALSSLKNGDIQSLKALGQGDIH